MSVKLKELKLMRLLSRKTMKSGNGVGWDLGVGVVDVWGREGGKEVASVVMQAAREALKTWAG